jgi:L-iditol 2-dehydrogenase
MPGPREVLIAVQAAGICGSDLHIYNWDTKVKMAPPVIIGHEFCGTIVELGTEAEGEIDTLNIGDRVTAEPTFKVCGSCRYCQSGFYNLCAERQVLGFAADGAFAEFVRVPAKRVHALPDNVEDLAGAMIEPFACCVHGLYELTGVVANDFAVVSGPGAMGLLAVQLLREAGARVLVIGTAADEQRLALARTLGADLTLNVEQTDVLQEVLELSGGAGADLIAECSGAPAAAELGIDIVRKRGKYLQLGLFGKPITLDFEKIAYKELQIFGSFAQKWSAWKTALSLLDQGKIQLVPLVSDVLPLTDWQLGFEKLNKKTGLKIVLTP